MTRLLFSILTISFLFTTAPSFAQETKDACMKSCIQSCKTASSPGKCNESCTLKCH
jgi:hypothetical protein